jgi:5-methyltetrahydrofolate--homocysteine methyltransferase
MADLSALAESIINGKAKDAKELVQKALDAKVPVSEILNNGLIKGMSVVGEKFKNNEFYVPEVLIAARAMHGAMDIVKPLLAASGIKAIGVVSIGTVKGDLHDIGKNLVVMMLEGAGFEVMDIAMSALLTTTMTAMKTTIDALKEAGVRDKVKVMIGGAPVTQNYADEIGADGYARDAASGADKAKELLG